MNLKYILLRLIRHFLPGKFIRFLLLRGWVIRPGLETRSPAQAAERYRADLAEAGVDLQNKTILVFGYGGRFSLGIELLRLGAAHVVLVDKFAPPDDAYNSGLLPVNEKYLQVQQGRVIPHPAWMTLIEADIRSPEVRAALPRVDIVVSSSVYEHLDDVEGVTKALAAVTEGIQLHYVDLRDHYFKYPFEMLCYSEKIWYGWLNPTSNHNRYRLWDYQDVFGAYFDDVEITILERDEAAFNAVRTRVRPEFQRGDLAQDSVTRIKVVAQNAGGDR